MGMAGFDFVQFDGGHEPFTPDILDDLCRVAEAAGHTQSIGLPGQPNHPRVKEHEKTIRDVVHSAGMNMMGDITELASTTDIIYETAVEFLKPHGCSS